MYTLQEIITHIRGSQLYLRFTRIHKDIFYFFNTCETCEIILVSCEPRTLTLYYFSHPWLTNGLHGLKGTGMQTQK
jgi:hypothetical protein